MNANVGQNQPRFPCPTCFKQILVGELLDYVGNHVVVTEVEAIWACGMIAGDLGQKLHIGITKNRVRKGITRLRSEYISFRNFLKIPGVTYDADDNRIEIGPEYINQHIPQETAVEANFRHNGFENWEALHEIFRKRMFPNFPNDIPALVVDPAIYSDSDEDMS